MPTNKPTTHTPQTLMTGPACGCHFIRTGKAIGEGRDGGVTLSIAVDASGQTLPNPIRVETSAMGPEDRAILMPMRF